jgi:hypothetical protein
MDEQNMYSTEEQTDQYVRREIVLWKDKNKDRVSVKGADTPD